jgi:hypothetical protein
VSNLVPFNDMQQMADTIARSGLFGMKNYEQALALMLVAQAEGQHPATITQEYDIIQGKAARKTHSVLARFQQMGGAVEWHELTDATADATFSHKSGGKLRMIWTFDQAKKAGLTGKDNWKNYPRAMLRARCIAEGVRAVYPAALGGMLVSEEAQDLPAVEVELKAAPAPQRAAIERQPAAYPQADFDANLPKWRAAIESGKRTADDIIAMVQTKGTLSAEQIAAIRECVHVEEAEVVEVVE